METKPAWKAGLDLTATQVRPWVRWQHEVMEEVTLKQMLLEKTA